MSYMVCKRCSKMFQRNGRLYCDDCFEIIEKEHDLVIEYVRKYPDATILDIIAATGVTLKSIDCLVEEGFVSYVDNKIQEIDEERLAEVMDKILSKRSRFHLQNKK
ncbi:hypothetical protein KQI41_15505 [Tissierella pigra]|uniref:hypothetical protein n=1 Tax=Tissierella pigra TaxID=2607614 RepID=UPI001C106847|nr:hypothetical protein [Tissierella pigra]MBU5427796.1 hypothetical protein [Tissierella pigra]